MCLLYFQFVVQSTSLILSGRRRVVVVRAGAAAVGAVPEALVLDIDRFTHKKTLHKYFPPVLRLSG